MIATGDPPDSEYGMRSGEYSLQDDSDRNQYHGTMDGDGSSRFTHDRRDLTCGCQNYLLGR